MPRLHRSPVDGLHDRQREAIHHLASGRTLTETARKLGVSYATLVYWRKEEAFQKAMLKAQEERFAREIVKFDPEAVTSVVDELTSIVKSTEARDGDRVAAGRVLLSHYNQAHMLQIVQRRLSILEARLEGGHVEELQDPNLEEDTIDVEAEPPALEASTRVSEIKELTKDLDDTPEYDSDEEREDAERLNDFFEGL